MTTNVKDAAATSAATTAMVELKNMRKQAKAAMTRVLTAVEANNEMSAEELECRLGVLESYYKLCCETQVKIERVEPTDAARAEIDEHFVAIKTKIMTALTSQGRPNLNESFQFWPTHSVSKTSVSMLPSLQLPKFDGKYSEFKAFLASFKLLVHDNKSLCNTEKFNLLRQCLKDQPLEALSQFPNTNENYTKAYARLCQLYDNDCLIFLEHVHNVFEIAKISKPTQSSLRSVVDKLSASYSTMKTLGTYAQICDALFINLTMDKVDQETRRRWEDTLDFKQLPTWKECNEFLDRRCQRLEASKMSSSKAEKLPSNGKSPRAQSKSVNALSCSQKEAKSKLCVLCQSKEHWLYRCNKFTELLVADRWAKINQLGLCFNCLGQGHTAAKCQSKFSCKICKDKHHSLLHRENSIEGQNENQTVCNAVQKMPPISTRVILATALVLVKDARGDYHLAKALLDNCSQVNFIRAEFARVLHLKTTRRCVNIDGINNCHTSIERCTQTTIRSRLNSYEPSLEFLVTPTVSTYGPSFGTDSSNWNIPKNIELADPYYNQSQRIDMLIGGEIFFDLLSVGQIKLGEGMPTLQKTTLGWLVVGCISAPKSCNGTPANTHCTTTSFIELEKLVTRLWQLEDVVPKPNKWSTEQSQCEQFFVKTVKVEDNGRIMVKLPFKDDLEHLGSSHDIALRRFFSLERRLMKDDTLRTQYVSFMREYEQLGHMERVSTLDSRRPSYYIPHHCIMKPNSSTTKLRVVFDASCKTDSGKSLNDVMMVGPTIQNELPITLLNFRTHRYCLTGDITKMYRQVLVDPNDRQLQLIWWRESKNEPIKSYALKTVTYGTSAAPFLAIRSLHLAAERCKETYPIGAKIIKSDFYVDDMLSGAESIDSLLSIKHQVSAVLKNSGFDITKWKSNCSQFNHSSELKAIKIDADATSALGVTWDYNTDDFIFSYQPKSNSHINSKRSILSQSSSLFDPMGFLSPLLIRSKILLQELWNLNLGWDESIPQEIYTKWQTFLVDLHELHRIKVPRHFLCANLKDLQIHGFCDASIKAYGCVLYARSINSDGKIHSCIIVSKSRVAPSRIKTVPRLELCGALLLAKLWETLKSSLRVSPTCVYFWSDSQVVLHWLRFSSNKLTTFVGNRVAEIQEITAGISWNHVPTKENPSDLISRGATVEELMSSNWIRGPKFLRFDSSRWPSTLKTVIPVECNAEVKKTTLICQVQANPLVQLIHNSSNYRKLLHIFVYIHRFIRIKCKYEKLMSPLVSLQEMSAALQCVVSLIQHHHFANDIRLLAKNQTPNSPLKSLAPFIDNTGPYTLLRVGGRLRKADISETAKHQMLLPKTDPFVAIMLRHLHLTNYHAGPRALVAISRESFWIVNAREAASKVVNGCIQCIRYRPKLLQQVMGDLPRHRVTESRPFQHCGVDFFGPILTYFRLRGKSPYKSYAAVFIYFATKAVHLEAVSDLSTNKFIEALKRMIGRRGLPQQIYCDNATNFVGADRSLKEMRNQFFKKCNIDDVHAYCSSRHIQFSFIPPRAPHFGGLWEAAVKVAKGHLLRTLSHARLTFEELSTALIEIEAVMNSRPLCHDSSNPNELAVLTPGHALIGTSLKAVPEPVNIDSDITQLQRFQRIAAVKAHFWQRLHVEYLHELQNRSKWQNPRKELSVGDVVLVHDDNAPPMKWLMAKVQNTVKGADGHVRVAELKTTRGIIKRPITKLALLPKC